MKRAMLYGLMMLFCLLPGLAQAGGAQRDVYAVVQHAPVAAATPIPAAAMETVPPESVQYPCTAVAAAPNEGDTVPLYAGPDAGSEVLMRYYRGTRITVLRETLPGFVMVQCGTREASVMGYMKKSDLAFGSAALREIAPEFVKVKFNREAPIYAYCDDMSGEIGTCTTQAEYYTIGKNDGKWVQLYAPAGMQIEGRDDPLRWSVYEGDGAAAGFVQLETGMARGYEARAVRWAAEPIPGEITKRQAIELAIWWMMNAQGDIPDALRDEAALRMLPFEAEWMCSPPGSGYVELSVTVSFSCDAYTITVGFDPDGAIRYGRYEEAAQGS